MEQAAKLEVLVSPVQPEQLPLALELLYAHLPEPHRRKQVARTLRDSERGAVDLSGLFCARDQDQLVGVLFSVIQPGRAAMLWTPSVQQSTKAGRVADALLQTAQEQLARHGVVILQALLDPTDQSGAQCLTRNGYKRAADLLYLERCLAEGISMGKTSLQFANYTSERHAQFAAVVEQTYEGSLDAPELNGVRSISDVLAGYRAVGAFEPARWLLAYAGAESVGCLLMAEHAELDAWEVVYLGVVPRWRGRGLGRELTLEAFRRARSSGARRVLLAVDQNNRPACNLYTEVGFQPRDRRSVFLRVLRDREG